MVDEVIQDTQDGVQPNQEQEQDIVYDIPEFGEVSRKQLEEWKNGYMRQSDYTKKTQELAEQRKAIVNQPSATNQTDLEKKVKQISI
jgi:hypothetical protein